ncbi:MAG: DUF6428 family protein [Chitinophagales bacterium]
MNLKAFKQALQNQEKVEFNLPNGKLVPKHFHITEVGVVSNKFIDCGGNLRQEIKINFQLWKNIDLHHRLSPQKLLGIIGKAESTLELDENYEIQVEYQQDTVCLYNLDFKNGQFQLANTKTDCLAMEACGLEVVEKTKLKLSEIGTKVSNCCTPESGCC